MKTFMREASRDDGLRLDAFLKRHNETSMFMRSNLREYGFCDFKSPYAMRYFLRERGGAIQGVGAVSNSGMLMMQAPEGLSEIAQHMQRELPKGVGFLGMLGDSAQVENMREAFGLKDRATGFDRSEPLFTLDLENLLIPEGQGFDLRPPNDADVPMLETWAYDYMVETGLRPAGDMTRAIATNDVANRREKDRLRILLLNGTPITQTAFNAVLPDSVQVGGVYTPPENRAKGYGRLAVALHLDEVRKTGVQQAVLFSNNEYASRAYRSIGFEHVGAYTITLFS